eukprot:gnl/MRDRNA2_/MRDRNA2_106679_c0_seq1.p1 gnl/MRDRNA2_/MRDRNA2_106679_c0~~gnl/MRDRNA2_/MRDRNA2_106679_c0_seq1.p1  ORF type:complete len:148 (-),score=27.48 gnl/MRDRNA2_/MRDRNA2_106679_c0_seq1:267-710(-)
MALAHLVHESVSSVQEEESDSAIGFAPSSFKDGPDGAAQACEAAWEKICRREEASGIPMLFGRCKIQKSEPDFLGPMPRCECCNGPPSIQGPTLKSSGFKLGAPVPSAMTNNVRRVEAQHGSALAEWKRRVVGDDLRTVPKGLSSRR